MDNNLFRMITAVLLIVFVLHRGYYTRKAQESPGVIQEQPNPGAASRIAAILTVPALLAALIYVFFPAWMDWAMLPLMLWLRWLGVGLALLGFALLQWSQNTLGRNWSDAPKLLKDQQLVVSGPYRWIRHPIYTAFLLILGSLILISANWLVGGLWILIVSVDVVSRIRIEEDMMVRQFGKAYRTYTRRTGGLVPHPLKLLKVRGKNEYESE